MGETVHQIGEVAERVGLSLRTVRYYEEVGLVTPSDRTAGGFRLYTDNDVERLELVKHLKPLGFSLETMNELLELHARVVAGQSQPDDRERLEEYVQDALQRCEQLRLQLEAAEQLAARLESDLRTAGH